MATITKSSSPFITAKCPKCGKLATIIPTNNPILPGVCSNCLNEALDPNNLKQADFFCRSYNIPFHPNEWLDLVEKVGDRVFQRYVEKFFESEPNNVWRQGATSDLWGKANEEWERCRTFEELLVKIDRVRESFMSRCRIKWGPNYSFEQMVQLENLLVSTLRANDISNPLQIDAIKKACRISIELDRAIEDGDSKGIKELSSAYSSFTKTAQIDNVIAAANNDVITTVADLAEEIERCGGQFRFYDNVDRDIVDKTIKDIKEYIRTLVADSTGLGNMLETIGANYRKSLEETAAGEATSAITIEDIIRDQANASNASFDAELADESVVDMAIEEVDTDDDYNNFF